MPKAKKYFLIFLLAELLLSYTPAQAFNYATDAHVSDQIKTYLCAPTPVPQEQTAVGTLTIDKDQAAFNNANSGDLFLCINRLYKLAIVIACVVGVFFIVIAGYVYMGSEGNAESVEKAKSILISTLTSIVILLAGFVLLKAINPDLIKFQTIQPPSVKTGDLPTVAEPEGETTNPAHRALIGKKVPGVPNCTGCVDYSGSTYGLTGNGTQDRGKNTFLEKSVVERLARARASYGKLVINEAYPPTVDHAARDDCHFTGTCADIGTSVERTEQEVEKLCKAVKDAGLQIWNEYKFTTPSCGTSHVTGMTTGGHLHVY